MSMKKEAAAAGLPPSDPVALGELVSYQDGSIVSRTLVKKNGGNLTLFAFDAGQSLSEHAAPFDWVSSQRQRPRDVSGGSSKPSAR